MTNTTAVLRRGPYIEIPNVRRIAVLHALHLGDFLCLVPALRALKGRFPEAEVTLIGLPWLREIIGRYPYVDRFLEFPGYLGLENVPWEPQSTRQFLRAARDYGYDLAIQMHGDGRVSNRFVARLGARVTLGYRPAGAEMPRLLDLEMVDLAGEHQVRRWLRLVKVLGAVGRPDLEFPLTPHDWIEAERVAGTSGIDLERPMVGIHPGARDPARRWPPELFAEAADRLAAEMNAQVVITGVREEWDVVSGVAAAMRARAFVVAGDTSLGGLAALLAQMPLVVANDTGPAHLAAAVGTPTLVLFGPTDPSRWGAMDARRHGAVWSGLANPIGAIPVDTVVQEALKLVERCAYPMS